MSIISPAYTLTDLTNSQIMQHFILHVYVPQLHAQPFEFRSEITKNVGHR